jgi:hypothetical protein
MVLLEIEPLDLGDDVRSISLELTEADENREPIRGEHASRVWSRVLRAAAAAEPWVLDFFSHIDRVGDYCTLHKIPFRESGKRVIVVAAPEIEILQTLLDRFQSETFGVRAGSLASAPDPAVEGDLARRGIDGYHAAYKNYFFCAACGFEDGSLVLFSEKLSVSEVIRRVRPALEGQDVEVRLPA